MVEDLDKKVVAEMLMHPERTFKLIELFGVKREYFEDETLASAFSAMLKCGWEDAGALNKALLGAMPQLGASTENMDEFMSYAPSIGNVDHDVMKFCEMSIRRETSRKVLAIYANTALDPRAIQSEIDRVNSDMDLRLKVMADYRNGTIEKNQGNGAPEENSEDSRLLDMPGFVNGYADYIFRNSHRPNRTLAFAGALAMLSLLVARKYTDKRKTMTNLYIIALAGSGVGKDAPRKINKRLAADLERSDAIADQTASGEGIEDALYQTPASLFMIDEFDAVLNTLKESNPITEGMYRNLLTFFSESGTIHAMRKKAITQAEKQAMANNPAAVKNDKAMKIEYPSLTLFATAIPDKFYRSLTIRALENGLVARCLVLESGHRGDRNREEFDDRIPFPTMSFAQAMADRDKAVGWNQRPEFFVVPDGPGVAEAFERKHEEADRFYDEAENRHDEAAKAVWNRAVEITGKLALLYALSGNLHQPMVTVDGVEWSWKLVRHCLTRMLEKAGQYLSVDKFDDVVQTVLRCIREYGSKGVNRSMVSSNCHVKSKLLDEVVETLEDRGEIEVVKISKGGVRYVAKRNARKGR